MKTRDYLQCVVTDHNGNTFTNPLRLDEVRLINTMARNNPKVVVTMESANEKEWESLFG